MCFKMGIETEKFVSPVDDDFMCIICTFVLDDPVYIDGCEHMFCRNCIEEWMKQNATCPVDRNPINNLIAPHRSVVSIINKLKVKCEFESMGCEEVVHLGDWKNHLKQCDFNPEKKITTTSADKWNFLKQLPLKLKNRVRLAFVLNTGFAHEAVFTTEDDEMFWLKTKLFRIDVGFSRFKVKQLLIGELIDEETCVLGLNEGGQIFAWSLKGHRLLENCEDCCLIPKPVSDLICKTVVEVACGNQHVLALTDDGEVWSWGVNFSGQLGRGSAIERDFQPKKVTAEIGSRRAVAVACFSKSSFAVMDNGDVYSWGDNDFELLSDDDEFEQRRTPTKLKALSGVKIRRFACGIGYLLAAADDGSLFAWGDNRHGRLGTGDRENRSKPVKVRPDGVKFIEVVACHFTSVALSDDGRCWVWGWCRTAIGLNETEDVLLPKPVKSTSIHDALADYSLIQMSCKTMLIRHQ